MNPAVGADPGYLIALALWLATSSGLMVVCHLLLTRPHWLARDLGGEEPYSHTLRAVLWWFRLGATATVVHASVRVLSEYTGAAWGWWTTLYILSALVLLGSTVGLFRSLAPRRIWRPAGAVFAAWVMVWCTVALGAWYI